MARWTETAIKQAFDSFIKKHDRLPTRKEMYVKYAKAFPRPNSIKTTMGMTIGEYFKLNYNEYLRRCDSNLYGRRTKEYWIDDFKKQFVQLGEPTELQYNKLRAEKTPNSITLTKIAGVSTWRELLKFCELQRDRRVKLEGSVVFEPTLENYQKLSSKLQEIVKNFK